MILVHDIEIPIDGGDEFCTPDMQTAMDFYPKYKKACEDRGNMPWSRRAYLVGVCNAVARTGIVRDGRRRSKDELLCRVLEHFGINEIGAWFDRED